MINQFAIVGKIIKIKPKSKDYKITELIVSVKRPPKKTDGTFEIDSIKCSLSENIGKSVLEHCSPGDTIGINGRIQSDGENNIIAVEKAIFLNEITKKNEPKN